MKMLVRIGMMSAVALGMLTASSYLRADDRSQDLKRIHDAQEVFHELMETPDRAIPHELLESAKCIAIIPGQKKVGYCRCRIWKGLGYVPQQGRLEWPRLSDDHRWRLWTADWGRVNGCRDGFPQPRRLPEAAQRQIQNWR